MSGVITTVYTLYEADRDASKAADRSAASLDKQFEISQQQIDMGKEQWESYKTNILPLEMEAQQLGIDARELAQQRGELDFGIYEEYYAPMSEQFAQDAMDGIEAQPERAARDARLDIDQAFDSEEGMVQRNLERRGVRPGSGAYESSITDTSLSRAAAKGFAVNRAVEGERDRVEDTNFNRQAVALGRQPLAQTSSQGGVPGMNANTSAYNMAAGGNTAQGAGAGFGDLANMYSNNAGNIVSGGIQLGSQVYDLWNKYSTPSPSGVSGTPAGYNYNPDTRMTTAAPGSADFAEGGEVQAPMLQRGGYAQGGEVNGPPGIDQVPAYIEGPNGERQPARLTENEFIIPADVVKVIGTGPLDDIIEKARSRKERASQSPNALTRRIH